MISCRIVAALLTLFIASSEPVLAQSSKLLAEIQTVNQAAAEKDYARAIPHAELAVSLAGGDASVSAAQRIELLNVLAQLYYLEADYPSAERVVRQALDLRRTDGSDVHAIAVSEEDLAELLDLQGRFDAAAPLHAGAAPGLQTVLRGGSTPTSALGRHDTSEIIESAYDYFNAREPEEPGYGRYTYVILRSKKERGTALLATLFDAPAGSMVGARNRAVVNAFEIPISAGRRDDARKATAPAVDATPEAKADRIWTLYDFAAANNLLLAACKAADPSTTTKACADIGAGPYLITFARPVNAFATLPQPYLVVDMSNMQNLAFTYIVGTMQSQLKAKDLASIKDAGGIHSTQTGLLNTVLVSKDWLTPISDSVTQWMKFVSAK